MPLPKSLRFRLLRAVAAIMLAVGGITVAAAAPAGAATCTHPAWSNPDAGSGHGNSSSTAIHDGPYSGCGIVTHVGSGTLLYYHCWLTNSVGNTWTHVRIAGGYTEGWVWDANLDDYGATQHC
jgi:hypothetical protein